MKYHLLLLLVMLFFAVTLCASHNLPIELDDLHQGYCLGLERITFEVRNLSNVKLAGFCSLFRESDSGEWVSPFSDLDSDDPLIGLIYLPSVTIPPHAHALMTWPTEELSPALPAGNYRFDCDFDDLSEVERERARYQKKLLALQRQIEELSDLEDPKLPRKDIQDLKIEHPESTPASTPPPIPVSTATPTPVPGEFELPATVSTSVFNLRECE